MSDLIPASELTQRLRKFPEWDYSPKRKRILRTFEFDEFMDGIDFVNGVAEIADESGHHPDIDIRYNIVRCALTTHDQGGVTSLDLEMALRIDTLVD